MLCFGGCLGTKRQKKWAGKCEQKVSLGETEGNFSLFRSLLVGVVVVVVVVVAVVGVVCDGYGGGVVVDFEVRRLIGVLFLL